MTTYNTIREQRSPTMRPSKLSPERTRCLHLAEAKLKRGRTNDMDDSKRKCSRKVQKQQDAQQ